MKNSILFVLLFSTLAGFSQSKLRKKKVSIGVAVMRQSVTENFSEGTTPFFEHKKNHYDLQFKIGQFFFKEKITAGLAIGFNSNNVFDYTLTRKSGGETTKESKYISSTEMQFGLFAKYKVYDEIFVDAYVGLYGLTPIGRTFPSADIYNIIKYNFSVGYSLHIWHFLAVEPSISIRNSRKKYRGVDYLDDNISPLSFGLGLTFKL